MKKYAVTFHPDAEQDIRTSYTWGCRAWGEKQAQQWMRELHSAIKKRLAAFPESCPLAPESEELGVLVRQFVVQRYRVLFIVKSKRVIVLHVRGAYVEGEDDITQHVFRMRHTAIKKGILLHEVLARDNAASKRRGINKLSAREIEVEITAHRKEKRHPRPTPKGRKKAV